MTPHKKDNNIPMVAIGLSVVALVLSLFSSVTAYQAKGGEDAGEGLNAKVEAGIEAYVKKQQQKNQPAPKAPTGPVDVTADDDAVKGDKDAPVTIIEFSDYECPYCKRYVDNTLSQITEKYIKTGKVKYIFRDFPLGFHKSARPAGIAAECFRKQTDDEGYWDFHDKLFENNREMTAENLKAWAVEMGADGGKFDTCMADPAMAKELDDDMAEGSKYGVRGTPAFFINGINLSGAQPFAKFEEIIEAELKK